LGDEFEVVAVRIIARRCCVDPGLALHGDGECLIEFQSQLFELAVIAEIVSFAVAFVFKAVPSGGVLAAIVLA
jgi:hypothetical protein